MKLVPHINIKQYDISFQQILNIYINDKHLSNLKYSLYMVIEMVSGDVYGITKYTKGDPTGWKFNELYGDWKSHLVLSCSSYVKETISQVGAFTKREFQNHLTIDFVDSDLKKMDRGKVSVHASSIQIENAEDFTGFQNDAQVLIYQMDPEDLMVFMPHLKLVSP